MSKLTPWFVATEHKPARVGWYAVTCKHGVFGGTDRLYWSGKQWEFCDGGASTFGGLWKTCDSWRGLKSKSGAGEKG